jgi:hypothetical protein
VNPATIFRHDDRSTAQAPAPPGREKPSSRMWQNKAEARQLRCAGVALRRVETRQSPLPQRIRYTPPPALTDARPPRMLPRRAAERRDMSLISVLIGILVIVVVGAICFWAIDKFANDRRLASLLKLLVVLICLGAILQRVLPLTY